jgi:glutathione synthase/RimK-type ligase-like ATP-grasp enzyme
LKETLYAFSVLITDVTSRKAFDLANILNQHGIDLILAGDVSGIECSLLQKAYGRSIYTLRKDEHFDADLKAILEKESTKSIVYIPIEEDTTLHVYAFLKQYHFVNFYHNLPPEEAFDIVRDKGSFARFCEINGIPVPKSYKYSELIRMEHLPGPLILKPKSGSGSVGIRFIDDKTSLENCSGLDMQRYIIQERLENPQSVEGGFFLFDKGVLAGYYGHRRIRTYPPQGGVTVFSKCHLDTELKSLGERLLSQLNWSGLAMVEFLYDTRTQSYKIIEVNPRLWGSLMLAEFCGSNMLINYCRSALGLPLEDKKIETERYIRWLFPWDFLGYLRSFGRIERFWSWSRNDTCYINASYTTKSNAAFFLLYNFASPAKLKRLVKKVWG